MKIKQAAMAGTLESSDIQITIEPSDRKGIEIHLSSPVIVQYGDEIKRVIQATLERMKIESAEVHAVDKGAMNCTVEARTYTAAIRACEGDDAVWEVCSVE